MKITTFIKSALLLLLITSSFAACKKDDTKPKIALEGKWTAKLTYTDSFTSTYYFTFKNEGGILEVREFLDGIAATSTGTWFTTPANAFTAKFFVSFDINLKGTYNPSTGTITNGKFGLGDSYDNAGTWTMTKDKVQ
ncbi:MAG: hypothetical protein WBP45_12400 [Daejeonella sp.]